ncbi:hypothetical protein [Streptomyces sp. NPDC001851]|uniref:hypothetical protein n=1 Tax=Streptomyces sp. NPDC001851 TaxID=3154529 RepID=UPI00332951F1
MKAVVPSTFARTAIGVLGLVALVTSGLTVAMLVLERTHYNIVVIGGTAGSAASSIALLFRRGGLPEFIKTIENHAILAVIAPIIGGFFVGSFSLMTVIALFNLEMHGTPLASSAVFGGLCGFISGGWINRTLTPISGAESERNVASVAIERIAEAWRGRYNYRGRVAIEVKAARGSQLLLGTLVVTFIPEAVSDACEYDVSGGLRVEDGSESEEVPFEISILEGGLLEVYPDSLAVKVPAAKKSQPIEFTVTRPREQQPIPGESSQYALLVDVSQAGRSLQLLEITPDIWGNP